MYHAATDRYAKMPVRHAGKTGLMLPAISLGLWQHYGNLDPFDSRRSVILDAFDHGVFHFDVANHYGNGDVDPGYGSSETLLGQILATDLKDYRDELVISTKVGYEIHPGPYGIGTSRKAVIQGLNDSLKRLRLDYVDIYYAHRFDDTVALEETVNALDQTVRDGKALYIGISNYDTEQTKEAIAMFKDLHTPFVLNQFSYNMFNREAETSGLTDALKANGAGLIAYGPLSEGLLSDRYLNGIPDSFQIHRTNKGTFAKGKDAVVKKLNDLNKIAQGRGQKLSQMALAWLLRDPVVTSVIIGTTSVEHLEDNLKATEHLTFTAEEVQQIDDILNA
ncbi:aldo keto reductase [Lacticaseibacillus zeae DSM 20178 = KCTC 3804]|jgi:L-glyceraldehyde 3-phosphate reductase|uniref:Aldo/keto reductase n=2 Tax=Lacticaseibacillus zeae TaxID=57037 RepID=A0A5R8LUE5_LACZE|nr:aldo/keto reductase [Lacticaseibacillus zeae]KRK12814.1 aldo keto reductase [Lacticaseibacillus zeae DSM 20178 = KCTC 3804]OLS07043.1 aldo/keto reductase [Lacticaseibacillus casei]QVI31799.1 aldo/keto reductase [Lacticaseibacillus zeae]TLF40818.1 aldo/keto reductase [Lacticaseibacillus zeae]